MKFECNVIEDLLPLYKDGVCSAASAKAVEEHLAECPACSAMFEQLKDTEIDDLIDRERADVIGSQSRYFKRKSALVGSIFAAIFAVPILVCLIVNLATGHGLTWFFLVLAAMMIPVSLFVVPLMASKNKLFLSLTCFTASVLLLLAVICIYTGGSWFFVAASAFLLMASLIFLPILLSHSPLRERVGNRKGLITMTTATLTFFLMMVCIGLFVSSAKFAKLATIISVPIIAVVWILFLAIRYLPGNRLFKFGVCIGLISMATYGCSELVWRVQLMVAEDYEALVYSSPTLSMALTGVGIGALLAVIGAFIGKSED